MKTRTKRILLTVLGVVLLSYVIYHTVGAVYTKYTTQEAVKVTVSDVINAQAYAIRDEQTIASDQTGVMVYSVSNGTKVAKGATVVEYYNSDSDVALKKQIEQLEEKIGRLEEINSQSTIYVADLDLLASQIKENLYTQLDNIDDNNFKNASTYDNNVLYYLCQNQLATGRVDNYNDVIEGYKQELNTLQSQLSDSKAQITSDYSGYFVNTTDGYENVFDYENAQSLTAQDFDKIGEPQKGNSDIGKIITAQEWYLYTVISSDDALGLAEGGRVTIRLPLSTASEVEFEVKKVNIDYTEKKAAILFATSTMNEELSTLRSAEIQIVVDTYTGLHVPSEAVRIVDEQKGVYVMVGDMIKFRKMEILYTTEDYVIADITNKDGYLKIYDEVIIKGKGLNE